MIPGISPYPGKDPINDICLVLGCFLSKSNEIQCSMHLVLCLYIINKFTFIWDKNKIVSVKREREPGNRHKNSIHRFFPNDITNIIFSMITHKNFYYCRYVFFKER